MSFSFVSKASFTEKSVSKEREIIQQEIGMYQDSPDYRLFFGAFEVVEKR